MKPSIAKFLAVLEVMLVTFALVPLLTLGLYRLFPGFETWQTQSLGFPFPVFVDAVMVVIALLAILVRRRPLREYGITFENPKYHLDIAGACFVPVVLASMPFGFGVDHKSWSGALLLAAINIALLFALAQGVWIARKTEASATPEAK